MKEVGTIKNIIKNIFLIVFVTILFCYINDVKAQSQSQNGWITENQEY